jgi:hypothetical protein
MADATQRHSERLDEGAKLRNGASRKTGVRFSVEFWFGPEASLSGFGDVIPDPDKRPITTNLA